MKFKKAIAFLTSLVCSLSMVSGQLPCFLQTNAEETVTEPVESSLSGEINFLTQTMSEQKSDISEDSLEEETTEAVTEEITQEKTEESTVTAEPEPNEVLSEIPETIIFPDTVDILADDSVTSDGFSYQTSYDGSSITITGYKGSSATVTVPDTINGIKVTSIADYAFRDNTSITSVNLGKVTYLGYSLFSGCTSLKSVTIPKTVTSCNSYSSYYYPLSESSIETVIFEEGIENIPAYVCAGAKALKNVTIPEKLDNLEGYNIGNYAFAYSGLEEITIPDTVLTLGSNVFSGCEQLTKVNFSTDLTNIGSGDFSNCTSLKTFTIPNGVTTVGNSAFSGCKYLDTVTIGTKTETIGDSCFQDCIRLKTVNMGRKVKTLGSSAFYNCISLSALDFANVETIGSSVLYGCKKITDIKLGSKAKTLNDYAFQGLENLESIDLGGVTYLGYSLFSECTSLYSLTIPKTVTRCNSYSSYSYPLSESSIETVILEEGMENIPDYICAGAKELKNVTIPEKLDNLEGYNIGNYAFAYSGLEEITIPDTILTLGSNVFSGCEQLTKVNFSTDLTNIGSGDFSNCTSLKTFTIPNGVTTVGNSAFYGCKYLDTVTIGTKTETIGDSCFQDCIRLKTVNMGKKVKTLGSSAFYNCISLSALDFANVETIGSSVLYGCNKITSIKLSPNAKTLNDYAFQGLENLISIDLGGVTYLGYSLFNECPTLASITIPKTVTRCNSYSSYSYPFSGSNIAVVYFESGMTTIPAYTCAGMEKLATVEIPSTVKEIGNYAFAYCPLLATVDSPRKSFDFYSNTFTSTPLLNDSRCTPLDNKKSYIQVSSMESLADDTINFTIKYAVNPAIAENARDYSFELELPDGVNLLADSVKSDDVAITSDNLTNGNFSVSASEGSVNFSVRLSELGEYKVSAYLTFYSNGYWKQKIGSVDITCPEITVSSAKTVNDFKVDVHGLAEKGENVYIYVNGAKAGTLQSNSRTGKYSGTVTLPTASAGTQYEIYAVCRNAQSSKVYTLYDTKKPAVKKITMHYNDTETLDVTNVFTDGASPVISLLSGTPVNFSIKATNSKNIYRMFVTSTKGDDVKYLEAFYNKNTDTWETDGYFDPYNTSYIPGAMNISIFEADVTEMNEKDVSADGLALENIPQEYIDNSSYDIIYEDKDKQLVEINLSDGKQSVDYKMFTGESDSMYIDGVSVSKEDIAKNPQKYNAVRVPYETVDSQGRRSIYYEIGQQSIDAVLQYESMMNGIETGILDVAASDHPLGTAILKVVEGENSDNIECILVNNIVSNSDTIFDIMRGSYTPSGFGAGEVLAIAGDTVNLTYRLSLPNSDSDVTKAAVTCWACKVGVTILGAALAATGPVGWAIAFGAGVAVEYIDSWLWKDFGSTQQFDSTSNKFIRFVVDPSGTVYDGDINKPVQNAKITIYYIDPVNGDRVMWEAEEYDQKNPMYTDKNGCYACDVPEGDWIVVCSVAGYSDIESEVLSIPPERTDINFDISTYKTNSTLKGDANMDGKVTIADVVAVLQYIANNEKYSLSSQAKQNADVDGSSGITGKDALVIQQYDAGIVTSLPLA